MVTLPEKKALLDRLCQKVQGELAVLAAAARNAADAATHEENKPEHHKDMRSTEASYLARGQAARVEDLAMTAQVLATLALRTYDEQAAVGVGALVEVEDEEETRQLYFLLPRGGGLEDVVAGRSVRVVTEASPLGAALAGMRVGDDLEVTVAGRRRELLVTASS